MPQSRRGTISSTPRSRFSRAVSMCARAGHVRHRPQWFNGAAGIGYRSLAVCARRPSTARCRLRRSGVGPNLFVMATASHPDVPISSDPAGVSTTLAALEGTLSNIASQAALAAESLRDHRGDRRAAPDSEAAGWWLDRVVRDALSTRDTCRAARAAIDEA
jgi:hypothetical protein